MERRMATAEESAEQRIQEIWSLYDQAYLFQARNHITALKSFATSATDDDKRTVEAFLKDLRCSQLYEECEEAECLVSRLTSDEGWHITGSSTDVSVFYRYEKDTALHAIKIRGEIKAPLLHVLAMINEVDLYRLWLPPMVEEAQELAGTRYRKVVYVRAKPLWPLAARELLAYGYSVDDLQGTTGAVLVILRDLQPTDDLAPRACPPSSPAVVRMHAALGGVMLRPLGPQRTLLCQISRVDPKLPYVPSWLLNLCNQQLAPHAFRAFAHAAAHPPGSAHAARIQANPALYDDLRARLEASSKFEK